MRNRRRAADWVALITLASLLVGGAIVPAPAFARTRTTFTATLNKTTVTYALPATLTGVLKTSSGRALPNTAVKLYRGSAQIGTYKTDKYGKVVVRVKYPGTVSWQLRYAGSSSYYSSSSPSRSTRAVYLINKSFDGQAIAGSVNLIAGRSYEWSVNGKAPTISMSASQGGDTIQLVNLVLGTQTTDDGTGTETSYYWWTESRAFVAPKTYAGRALPTSLMYSWSVKGVYYPAKIGYFRLW
jgi:hypothetical protein